MRFKRLATLLIAFFLGFGCQEPEPGPSVQKFSLQILPAFSETVTENPFSEVAFVRMAIDGPGVQKDSFYQYVPSVGVERALKDIPFGSDLRITIEGWSMGPDQGLGDLISRGRTPRFDMSKSTQALDLVIRLARVNAFSRTSTKSGEQVFPTNLNEGRVGHTVTSLVDGRIVIIGGASLQAGVSQFTKPADLAVSIGTVEVYDPLSGQFTMLTGIGSSLATPRAFHTATLLPDGRILVAGGFASSTQSLNTFEVFNPGTLQFEPPVQTVMSIGRGFHTANLLDSAGHVAFVGGLNLEQGVASSQASVEVHNLVGGLVWNSDLSNARHFHTATRAVVGAVGAEEEALIIVGGENDSSAIDTQETFYFLRGQPSISPVVQALLGGPRTRHTATYIESQGFIHIVGGFRDKQHTLVEDLIDSFSTNAMLFPQTNFRLLNPRGAHSAVSVPGNTILVFGGYASGNPVDTAEVVFEFFNPEDQKVYIDRGGVGSMMGARADHVGVALPDGTVLAVGGVGANAALNLDGEYFNPL